MKNFDVSEKRNISVFGLKNMLNKQRINRKFTPIAGCFVGVLCDSEHGGSTCFRNFGILLPYHTVSLREGNSFHMAEILQRS
jgi:hypothetical protein